MAFVTPKVIPKRGGGEVGSWRASPSLVPAASGKSPSLKGKSSPKPPPPAEVSPPAPAELPTDDHLVQLSIEGVSRVDVERALSSVHESSGCGYLLHIGPGKHVPLERDTITPDTAPVAVVQAVAKKSLLNPAAAPFATPAAVSASALAAHGEGTPSSGPDGGSSLPPAMELPPPAETKIAPTRPSTAIDDLFVAVYPTAALAQAARDALHAAFPSSKPTITARKRSQLNTTIVLKGVPFQTRVESLVEGLVGVLSTRPSYVRLHRSERGVFKCVLFLKFATRVLAECAKFELERIVVGSRPLRVEFKKQQREEAEAAAPNGGKGGRAPAPYASMEQAVAAVAKGDTHGCVYAAADLKAPDARYLHHLALVYGLQMITATSHNVPADMNLTFSPTHTGPHPEHILIRKKPPPPPPSTSPSAPPAGIMDRATPRFQALSTPKQTPNGHGAPPPASGTPQWSVATPGSLQPMAFRGIRHWRDIRAEATAAVPDGKPERTLGVYRPVGPGTVDAFGSGRGRPVN